MIDYDKLTKQELISLLEKSQEEVLHLKNVLDHLPGSIYWKDKNGVYLGHNEFATNTVKKMGYQWDTIVGRTDHEVFPKEMADNFRENDILTMENETEITMEERSITHDGRPVIQLSTKKPFYDKHGQVAGIIANTINITRFKEIAAELNHAKEAAETANQFKSQIIQNMEHDIRTPFAGILALSNLLRARETDPDKKEKLESISECAQELLDYCNELLEVVNLESSKLSQKPILFNVRALVDDLMKAERPAATIRGLNIIFECDSDVPHYLLGDRIRLYRILLNLLSNAIKFTQKGQINIRLRVAKIQKDNQIDLIFEVIDTGIGIAKDKQEYIFEKFARITPSNHGIYKGNGLGLTFVKQFVTDMNGSIKVDSHVGKGSCFQLQLPFFIARKSKAVEAADLPQVTLPKYRAPKVLLIEDHIISQKVSSQVLKDCGCEVDAVATGRDAITAQQNNDYDLVLVDIGLPDIDGFTVIEHIRQQEDPANPASVAILTAHSSGEYRERAYELDVDKFVVKPLTTSMIEDLLKQTQTTPFSEGQVLTKQKASINGINFYYQNDKDIKRFHDVFHAGYYHFNADNVAPVIVDANANIGLSALYYHILYPQANIVCFEPDRARCQLLKTNARAHKIDNIVVLNKNLDDEVKNELANVSNNVSTNTCHCYNQCLAHDIDLLKVEMNAGDDDFMERFRDKLPHVKNLMITYHINHPQRHGNVIDELKKSLVPFYKKIRVVDNPNVMQTRQHLVSDPRISDEACYLIYASEQIHQNLF